MLAKQCKNKEKQLGKLEKEVYEKSREIIELESKNVRLEAIVKKMGEENRNKEFKILQL